jgi:hypothetical protein
MLFRILTGWESDFNRRSRPSMPRTTNALALPMGCALTAVFFLLLHSAVVFSSPDDLPDPFPIQRVLITPEQLPKEMQRVQQGILVQLPRADFEERVHKAAKAQAPKNAPRLIEARYRATLVEFSGLTGTGQWKIIHPGTGPALLPLQPLNLALQKARFENREALVAEFDGKTPALLVEDGGEHSLAIEWSARADSRPEGLYFALELPPAPVAVFELDLPADREASVSGGVSLSGPFPAEAADRRVWKMACGGRAGVNLWVRRSRPINPSGPALFVRQHTVQTLLPEGQNVTYQFDLDVTRPGVRYLVCEVDQELRPTEIAVANLERSEWRPAPAGMPAQLLLTLREPLPVGQEVLQIRCLAPLGEPSPPPREGRTVNWTSPGVRIYQVGFEPDKGDPAARVVPRGETLEVRCHPDVRLENWKGGGFRITDAAARPEPDHPLPFHALTLQGGGVDAEGVAAGKPLVRPSARLHTGGVDFRARQMAWWQIADDRMSLTLQITYDVNQGQLFQLPVLLPADWDIERVELNPGRLLRHWNVRQEKNRSILLVDLHQPVTPADDFRRDKPAPADGAPRLRGPTLTVRLNSTRREDPAGRAWPFPDATPLGARLREGAVAIDYGDLLYRGSTNPPLAESEPGEEEGPWGAQTPDHYFAYRGQPPQTALQLQKRPAELRAACTSDVYLGADRVETRLVLEAEAGSVDAVDVYLSAPVADATHWRVESGTNQLRHAERLYTGDALSPAALAAARRGGQVWRLTFTRPLRGHNPLVLHLSQELAPLAGRWDAPLPVVLHSSRMEGEVTLHLAGANRMPLDTAGLREVAPRNKSSTAWRTFRYGAEAQLFLRGKMPELRGSTAASVERADLTTFVHTDGGVEHHFSFDLANWPSRTLPLPLPAGSRPLAVRVDGHWLPRPATTENEAKQTVLQLPVPAPERPDAVQHFEVLYAANGAPWLFGTRVEAARPQLPVEPLTFRHIWRLPPGVSPFCEADYRRLPGPGEGFEPLDPRRWRPQDRTLFRIPLWSASAQDSEDGQRQALADAVQALRRGHAGQTLSLAEGAECVAAELAKGGRAFVFDAEALRGAGLMPETPLSIKPLASTEDQTPPWDGLGLTAVPAGTAVLLTTDRQVALWVGAAPAAPVSCAIASAVAEAAEQGQDATGRFRSALAGSWPTTEGRTPPGGHGESLADWTAWEKAPGGDLDTSMLVVRGEAAARAGLGLCLVPGSGLGAVLGLLVFWLRRWGRWRLLPLLAWLLLAGFGVLFLPSALQYWAWGPLVAGGLVSLLWYVVAAIAHRPPSAPVVRAATVGMAAGCLALLVGGPGPVGRAAPPQGVTVFVVPGPADAPEKQSVLAPPELLENLQDPARPPLGSGVVLIAADYDGKVVDGVADFTAVFGVQCLGDEPATLALPLDGVQLHGEALLDGARANPVALPAPQVGFALKVKGQGRHKLELHFRVPVVGVFEEHGVQFTAPRLVQNRLRLTVPKDATYVQALVKYGAQRVTTTEDVKVLEADLGRVAAPLHLRWFQETAPAQPAKVFFKEAYLWDLRSDAATLNALLHYDVVDGTATSLTVLLPPELEVRGADARRPPGVSGTVRLRDWKVDPNADARAVELRFASPVRGEVQVQLDLAPAAPLAATVTLPLPTPQGTPRGEGYLAYRVQGLEATRTNWLRVRGGLPLADFAPFWPAASRPEPSTLADAYAFRREGGLGPILTLKLRPQTAVRAAQEIAIRLGPQQARLHATLDLKAANGDLALVEWDVQSPLPVTVTAVSGPDVRAWTQANNRLQIWLERSVKETRVELFGWLPLAADNHRLRLELPNLRVVGAQAQQTTVRLNVGGAVGFAQTQPRNLTAPAEPTPGDQELVYQTDLLNYGGAFFVNPATAGPDVQVLTVVEVRDGRLAFTSTVDYQARAGELRTVNIRLSDWEGEEVRLDAPRVAQRRERRRTLDDRTWTLDLQTGATGPFRPTWGLAAGPASRFTVRTTGISRYRCTLSGTVPLADAAGGLRMPNVSVSGAGTVEYCMALAGRDLTSEVPAGLTPLANASQAPPAWKNELSPLLRDGGLAWKVAPGAEWKLRLSPRSGPAEAGPVVVFLTEQTAVVADQRGWLHEATYTFRHEAGAELTLTMPPGARMVSAMLDRSPVPQLQTDVPRLSVPLPGRAGVRRLHLRWTYDAGRDALNAPNLDRPRLDGARDGPVAFTVFAPPGYEVLADGAALKPGLARAASPDLAEATAQLAVSGYLAEQRSQGAAIDGMQLAESQRRFADICRCAERAVEATGDKVVADQLQALRKANIEQAKRQGYDDVRTDAERQASAATRTWPAAAGLPLYAVAPDGAVPHLTLQAVRDRHATQKWLAAIGWLLLLALVGVLACFRGLVSVARMFWPEQVALFGVMAWFLAGPAALALLLVLLGVAARLWYAVNGARRRLARHTVKAATTAHGSGNRLGT